MDFLIEINVKGIKHKVTMINFAGYAFALEDYIKELEQKANKGQI